MDNNIVKKNNLNPDNIGKSKYLSKFGDDFELLSDAEKVLILNSEKILSLDKKIHQQQEILKMFFSKFQVFDKMQEKNNYDELVSLVKKDREEIFKEIDSLITTRRHNDIDSELEMNKLLDVVKNEINNKFASSQSSASVDEDKIKTNLLDIYKKDLSAIEQRFESYTTENINDLNKKFTEISEKLDLVSEKYWANKKKLGEQEEKIDYLDNEVKNQILQGIEVKRDLESCISSYQNYNEKFKNIDDIKVYIRDESLKIAKEEISNYMELYNLFQEDRETAIIDRFSEENSLKESEIVKAYEIQLENNRKLDELQNLLDQQNDQIQLLSGDRQELLQKMNDLVVSKKDGDFLPHNLSYAKEMKYTLDVDKLLNKEEIEILVKKNAIEIVKDKINNLNFSNNTIIDESNVDDETELTSSENVTDNNSEFEHINIKFKKLEESLKNQLEENIKLKNDLFDEISKNSTYSEKSDFNNENNDIIKANNDNYLYLYEEGDEDMKHNYYGNQNYIPGTKITRIKNYKYNELADNVLNQDELIKQESEKLFEHELENIIEDDVNYKDSWEKNNQKLIELENLILKQEEEIIRLKSNSDQKDISKEYSKDELEFLIKNEAAKLVQSNLKEKVNASNFLYPSNNNHSSPMNGNLLHEIDLSMKKTLEKIEHFSRIQEKSLNDIELTNKKIQELEDGIRKSNFDNSKLINDIEEENARKDLERLIEEKYKHSNKINDYDFELKKIEDERKKINDTLELEKIRLLSEIESNKFKLQEAMSNKNNEHKEEVAAIKNEQMNNVQVILESPKRKRKQQIFYEVKVHTTPKLTRADIEK
ncbi:MAG: hypothetical protein RSA87_00645 [Malacoplasma sp.]